jgi:hypothetical protein
MDKEKSTQFMLKLVGDVGTALAAGLLLVGDRSGLFKAMAGAGMLSVDALAERAGIAPRYVEEWLAVMAGAGYVEHDAAADTFMLPDEHALFLTDDSSEYYLGGLFQGLPGLLAMTPRLVSAFKTGEGVAFSEFGAELPCSLEAMTARSTSIAWCAAGCLRCRASWLACKPEDAPSMWAAVPAWFRLPWRKPSRPRPSQGSISTRVRLTWRAVTRATPGWQTGWRSLPSPSTLCRPNRGGTSSARST